MAREFFHRGIANWQQQGFAFQKWQAFAVEAGNIEGPLFLDAQMRRLRRQQHVFIETVAKLAQTRLDFLVTETDAIVADRGRHGEHHRKIMPVQALAFSRGKNREMGGGELDVLLADFDGCLVCHVISHFHSGSGRSTEAARH